MSFLRRHFATRVVAVLCVGLAACGGFRTSDIAPQDLADSGKKLVLIRTLDGERVALRNPSVVNDSLVGERLDNGLRRVVEARHAIPVSQIAEVETPYTNTALLVVGSVLSGLMVVGLIALSQACLSAFC